MPVVFGTALAVVVGGARFSPLRFLWALATMMVLHGAANMLSDVFDFRRGLDRDVTPVSGAIVRGWLTDARVLRGAIALFALGAASGLLIAAVTGPALFAVGGIGVAVGVCYTLLKARALGDLAVFLDFGLLGGAGAWIVQTGRFSWLPVLWTVPMALLVIAILHANNWRDIRSDGERRVNTVAGLLGDRGSLAYYGGLVFAPFVIDLALVAIPRLAGRPGPTHAADLPRRPSGPAERRPPLGPGRQAGVAPSSDGLRHPGRRDRQPQPRLRPAQHGRRRLRGLPEAGMNAARPGRDAQARRRGRRRRGRPLHRPVPAQAVGSRSIFGPGSP
ncbi:MAG: prenyltransferase [Comamonadaceae bacterium]|nr:prenyltransferase [Comamonadaceae bacterium]